MSLTTTVTASREVKFETTPLILSMSSRPPDYVEQLLDILEKYAGLTDSLSQKLYEWGTNVLYDFSNKIITPEVEMEGAKRINLLKKLIEGNESHEFAKSMLEWLKILPELTKKTKPVTLSDLMVIAASVERTNQAMFETLREQEELANKLNSLNLKIKENTKEIVQREVKKQVDIAMQVELNDKRFTAVEETHKEIHGIQIERISSLQQKLHVTEERVTKAEDTSKKHELEIQQLRALYAQKQQEVDSLRNQGGGGGGKRCIIS